MCVPSQLSYAGKALKKSIYSLPFSVVLDGHGGQGEDPHVPPPFHLLLTFSLLVFLFFFFKFFFHATLAMISNFLGFFNQSTYPAVVSNLYDASLISLFFFFTHKKGKKYNKRRNYFFAGRHKNGDTRDIRRTHREMEKKELTSATHNTHTQCPTKPKK